MDKNENDELKKRTLSPNNNDLDDAKNISKEKIVSKIKQTEKETTDDNLIVNNRQSGYADIDIKNTRNSNKTNVETTTTNSSFYTSTINNTRQKHPTQASFPEIDTSNIVNTRKQPVHQDFDTSKLQNTRSKQDSKQDIDTSNVVNTRAKQFDTSSINNTRAKPIGVDNIPTKPVEENGQFVDFLTEVLQNQKDNQTVFSFDDFNIPQFDFSSFSSPNNQDLSSLIEKPKNRPPLPPHLQPKEKENLPEEQEITREESQISRRPKAEEFIPSTPEKEYVAPDIDISLQGFEETHPTVITEIPETNVQTEPIEVAEPEEIPETAVEPYQSEITTTEEAKKPEANKEASLDELFGIDNNEQQLPDSNNNVINYSDVIPEYEQKDILALVDISLNENVAALLASQNASDLTGTIEGVAEDLVVAKVKHSRKLWILLLVFLLGITILFACCYDSWFGKIPNEEEAKGLTLTIVPSSGTAGDLDAQYIFVPGSTIFFQDSVRIGSEKFRYEEQPDGSLKQFENNAFAFRFRFFVEFLDEGSDGNRPEHNEIISHVIEPEAFDDKIRLNPDDNGNEATNAYSYDGSWLYYFGIIYPGEKYIPFCDGLSLYQSIANEYQGKQFNVIMEYETLVPDGDVAKVLSEMPDAPVSWASQITSEYHAYYA